VIHALNEKLPFLNGRTFYAIFSIGILGQPLAIWFQLYKAWTAPSTEGISLATFSIMLFLQAVGTGYGIRIKESAIFAAMTMSFVGTAGILTALALR